MARITGKNAEILSENVRTTVSVAAVMTDAGAHTVYSYHSFWDPSYAPAITKQVHGAGPFNPVDPSLYTVDYIAGTITFGIANNSDDVVKVNGIQWMTLVAVAAVHNWTLDAKIDTSDVTAFQDQYKVKLSSFRGWSASAESYNQSAFWFPLFNQAKASYVKFLLDASDTPGFIGAAFIDFSQKAPMGGAVSESIKMEGTGALQRLT